MERAALEAGEMSANTSIEWTDASWNPIRGLKGRWSCTKVSPGCQNCYAEAMNVRFGGPPYTVGEDGLRLDYEALELPLRWRKPRRVFVCSMTDLFDTRVPAPWIEKIFDVMVRASHHTYQVLTKRSNRMRDILGPRPRGIGLYAAEGLVPRPWPHIWLGVSVEDQERADERVPDLLETPAAVRFVSAEPLLGPVDFTRVDGSTRDALKGYDFELIEPWPDNPPKVDWVIVGGESGPGARPCDLAWIRSIRDQCRAAGAAVFVKQLGRWIAGDHAGFCAQSWLFPGGSRWVPPVIGYRADHRPEGAVAFSLMDLKGGSWSEWPADLRVREWPT